MEQYRTWTGLGQSKGRRKVRHGIGPHCRARAAGLGEPESVLAVGSEEQRRGAGAHDRKDNSRDRNFALGAEQELVAQHRQNPHA